MKKREQKELINLLENFEKILDCNKGCDRCEYGILESEDAFYSCSIEVTKKIIWDKFNNPEWRKLHG